MRDDLKLADRVEPIVIRALEQKPEIGVPADFAARVARSMPAKPTARAELKPVFGRAAGYLALAAITVVLAALSSLHPEALEAGRGFVFLVELLLIAQLLVVGLWLGLQSGGLK